MLLKKVPNGKAAKNAKHSFADEIVLKANKQMKFQNKTEIPGPARYNKDIDWNKQLPKNTGKFKRSQRYLLSDEIINKSKVKEKSVPGPSHYSSWQWMNKSN